MSAAARSTWRCGNVFDDDRAISTVMDVALALLFITASIMIVGTYLGTVADSGDELDAETPIAATGDHEPQSATQLTESLSESTITTEYNVSDVRDESQFSEPVITDNTTYIRTDHGTPLRLLADAAIVNYRIDGDRVLVYGEEFEDAVDWSIRHTLLGTEQRFYLTATWEPYEGSALNGTATAGERPPATADVSSTTTTVESGMETVNQTALEAQWVNASADGGSDADAYAAAGDTIGAVVVEGLFPPEQSQYALEDQGIDRELTVYQYKSTVDTIGDFSFRSADTHPPLVRSEAHAEAANQKVRVGQEGGYDITDADALAAWIADDIPQAFDEEFDAIDETYDGEDRDRAKAEVVSESLSPESVTITVQTWTE